ncbi:MAG: hypothetical protein H7831_04685 [Magnetococcus sp. WYHC-3]
MKTLLVELVPRGPFVTPWQGDTLFGQLCWVLAHRHGKEWLDNRLKDYVAGNPFLVVSDPLPAGYLPSPAVLWSPEPPAKKQDPEEDYKQLRKRRWRRRGAAVTSSQDRSQDRSEKGIWGEDVTTAPAHHNTIDRRSGTTGTGAFAPFSVKQHWYPPEARLECWLLFDPQRLGQEVLCEALAQLGQTGYGKKASTGMGRFDLGKVAEESLPRQAGSKTWQTLAPCAPQGCGFDPERSRYQVFTRFGRHGDHLALGGRPFKQPLLLARTGALLTPDSFDAGRLFVGRGLGGDGRLSQVMPVTVHQGYAPVVGVNVAWKEDHHG